MQIRLPVFAVLLIFAVAIIPACLVTVLQYKQTYQAIEKSAQANMALHAKLANEKLVNHIAMFTLSISYFAKEKGAQDLENVSIRLLNNSLRQFSNTYSGIDSLYVLDANGAVKTGIGASIEDVQQADFFAKLKQLKAGPKQSGFIHISNAKLFPNSITPYGLGIVTPILRADDEVQGYLVALIANDTLSQILRIVLPEYNVAFYLSGKWIGGEYWSDPTGYSFHDFKVTLKPKGFANAYSLTVKLAEPTERLGNQVEEVASPIISTQLALIGILLILTLIFAHLTSRTLGRLNNLIRDFQSDSNAPQRHSFFIVEFSQVFKMFSDMKRTIGQQVIHLKKKNDELVNADLVRQEYIDKVEELNRDLEDKVYQRTAELEHTLHLVKEGNEVLERVIMFRRALQNVNSNEDIAILTLENLEQTIEQLQFAIYLSEGRGNGEVKLQSASANFDLDAMLIEIMHLGDEAWHQGVCSLESGIPVLRLGSVKQPVGWLAGNKMPELEYSQWLLLFSKELSNFLEIRALTQELDYLASTDSLTGLGNRKAFDDDMLAFETQLDSEVGLFIIDVNGLKQVNDNKGHEVGDKLLVKVAEFIRHCAQGITERCYRLGGDEYAIILSNEQLKMSQDLYRRLVKEQAKVDFAFDVLGGFDKFSCSIGYASTENTIFSMLYSVADQNMYSVKKDHYKHIRQR
ncbi:sensor domain-containing diguanylate cyclase [Motilimonas eburnea]|uniref:sensor domain-containing diguanylate cyclase n=1 Tax=Motilimonas eburnea TaxID=1737488 RepID=UPI001E2CBE93|nr:diguanylate cyclase [Motilimonas eburnea]MCE2573175.1 diguanylate cyclase [Motilimonas eburnea]